MWEQGLWSVADEHAATAVTEAALHALSAPGTGATNPEGPHLLFACAEGEWHALPARMAATVALAGGARVTVLGPSVPADHVLRRLAKGDVDVLALSCTMVTNLIGAARCISVAHEVGVPVIAGGRAFGTTPKRAERLGADRWGADATALLDPVPRLSERSTEISTEASLLDAVSEHTMDLAYSHVVAALPREAALDPVQKAKGRGDLCWMSRVTAAAVLTEDATVIDDFLRWQMGLQQDGRVPAAVVIASAYLVADMVEPEAPRGAAMLRRAADRIEHSAVPA
jgi:methylmalonyl-CoA mutase cobalamin-binding subunit